MTPSPLAVQATQDAQSAQSARTESQDAPRAAAPGRWRSARAVLAAASAATLLGACMHGPMHPGGHGAHHEGPHARADLQPTRGNTAEGWVMFHQAADGVLVHAHVTGLKPGSSHGFHIHERGDCSSGDGKSTGGHFNPSGAPHGPQGGAHHAGDLPSLQADANGVADLRVSVAGLMIGSGATDIVGRGLIVHADPDDYQTQPTGNAGGRIACAVIQPPR